MKEKLQGFLAGALAVAVIGTGSGLAKEAAESITAVYQNIKLVVDGVLIEPKDANGNTVEPFIYNGTTYLPVRSVAEAFGKEVLWDGENATVFLGSEVDKPAKKLTLWNRSYIECSDPTN
ncbi:MAG: stalk domain-containing protein, partial [Clostridia bacterium]